MGSNSSSNAQTIKTTYGKTTTKNPYVTSKTDNSGTYSTLNDGTALNSVYNFVNNNIDSLLNEYLNPNLNSVSNQSKINSYQKELNSNAVKLLENSIINPLSQRNMIRSSQASDLYKNLSNTTSNALENYISSLLSESQSNTANVINNLLKAYMYGYQAVNDNQIQSLNASQGNSTRTVNSSGNGIDSSQTLQNILLGKVLNTL